MLGSSADVDSGGNKPDEPMNPFDPNFPDTPSTDKGDVNPHQGTGGGASGGSIPKPDSVKYIIFTSKDVPADVLRLWSDKWQSYSYYLSDSAHRNVTFSPNDGAPAIVKPKSFLKTIQYADWNLLSKRMNKKEAEKMFHFFIHECHQWKRKSGKETKLYFIDRRDFSNDSIKMYRVYCRNANHFYNELIDELDAVPVR